MPIKVKSSAITSLLTSNVYYSATAWNNLSSNVSVSVVMHVSGMPDTGFLIVNGMVYNDGTLGETIPYDSNGYVTTSNANWSSVMIRMNTKSTAYSGASNQTLAAKKTFMHEVGHALKLSHPAVNSSYSGHIYNGYPNAIMNQGFPNSTYISAFIAQHDINNLIAKWGN